MGLRSVAGRVPPKRSSSRGGRGQQLLTPAVRMDCRLFGMRALVPMRLEPPPRPRRPSGPEAQILVSKGTHLLPCAGSQGTCTPAAPSCSLGPQLRPGQGETWPQGQAGSKAVTAGNSTQPRPGPASRCTNGHAARPAPGLTGWGPFTSTFLASLWAVKEGDQQVSPRHWLKAALLLLSSPHPHSAG